VSSQLIDRQSDDEISLTDLIRVIWEGKWLLALVTGVSVALAFVFYLFYPNPFKASLEIRPIPNVAAQRYLELNSFEMPGADQKERVAFFSIEQRQLLEAFTEELALRRALAQALRTHNYVKTIPGESDQDYEDRLLSTAYGFKLVPPIEDEASRLAGRPASWTLTIETFDPERVSLVLRTALEEARKAVRQGLLKKFETAVEIQKRLLVNEQEDLRLKRKNEIEDQDKRVRNRIAFLKEQAAIARSLGIGRSTVETQPLFAGSSIIANVTADSPFYLRGYEAIEKEMELLQQRSSKEAFAEELIEIERKLRALEQNKFVDRVSLALNNSPLVADDFQAAVYDLAAIRFEPKVKLPLVLALSVFAGLFLGLIAVFLRNAIRSERAQTA
jgi:LPS O-antigen subunit length determinant protein (WzzB/FepE family)